MERHQGFSEGQPGVSDGQPGDASIAGKALEIFSLRTAGREKKGAGPGCLQSSSENMARLDETELSGIGLIQRSSGGQLRILGKVAEAGLPSLTELSEQLTELHSPGADGGGS